LSYVLITPARNEEAFIEQTIRSVVAQTVPPVKWIIVSDGSTDGTDAIVQRYASEHPWIELLRMPEHRDRQFAAKAHCVNAAYAALKNTAFDVIGNLDADVSFAEDYFEFLLQKFIVMPTLGVAGTPYVEDGPVTDLHSYSHGFADLHHVSGPCQLFRRECFDQVGGYVPIKGGAIDWVAVTTARMKGWETRTFLGKTYRHHRTMGTAESSVLGSSFHYGKKAYYVGGHPLWALLRGVFRMRERPWIIGGFFFQLGFFWALITRTPRPVSRELMAFHRREQMARLRRIWRRPVPPRDAAAKLRNSSVQPRRDLHNNGGA